VDRDQFRIIVARLERKAARAPRLYRWGVTLRALFGYLFFPAALLLALAAIAAGGWLLYAGVVNALPFLLIAAGVAGAAFVGRAVSVRFERPRGVAVSRDAAPELWAAIDDVCRRLGRPRVHEVQLVPDLSAALLQLPRPGLVFGYRNYVLCGLSLMLGTTPAQFTAVLAHELGHLTRGHGRTTAWVYRLHRVWGQVLERLDRKPKHPLVRFIRWYAPRFAAHSFVLRRHHEYEADRLSAEVAGVAAAGDALVLTYLRETQHGKLWEAGLRRAASEPDPHVGILADVRDGFAVLPDDAEMREELAGSLAKRTDESDTHPSLADRLDRMGYLAERGVRIEDLRGSPREVAAALPLPAFAAPSAAEHFLGGRLGEFTARVAEEWATDVAERWDARHNHLLRNRGRLHLLDAAAAAGRITADEAFERATIVEAIEGDADGRVVALLDAALAIQPDHAPSAYAKGRLLLKRHDPAGVPLVEAAMARDPDAIPGGCELLVEHHSRANDHDAAERFLRRSDEFGRRLRLTHAERGTIRADERHFLPHGMSAADVRRVTCLLRSIPLVRRGHLVRRHVEHFPEKPCVTLFVTPKIPWHWRKKPEWRSRLAGEIVGRLTMRDEPLVFVLGDDPVAAAMVARLRRMPEFCVYDVDR